MMKYICPHCGAQSISIWSKFGLFGTKWYPRCRVCHTKYGLKSRCYFISIPLLFLWLSTWYFQLPYYIVIIGLFIYVLITGTLCCIFVPLEEKT